MPEVSDNENDDDCVIENKRGGKYNLRPNPNPTSLMNTDTSQIRKLLVPFSTHILFFRILLFYLLTTNVLMKQTQRLNTNRKLHIEKQRSS